LAGWRTCTWPEYEPLHSWAETWQVAVTVTNKRPGPHIPLAGATESIILDGLLLFARNCTNPATGLHVTESVRLAEAPTPAAVKLITKGFVVHVAFGVPPGGARTTEA